MLQTLKLVLPALIPSWRFFDWVAPSPRIEFALLTAQRDIACNWQEFRPRPARLSIPDMLKRLIWNPRWNESLFLVSCAERIIENPTEHSLREIRTRIEAEIQRHAPGSSAAAYLQFRLVFVNRVGTEIEKQIRFISPVYACAAKAGV